MNKIDEAFELINLFHSNNHKAYLVGGSVRDLLMEKEIKDIDITTDATPQQIIEIARPTAEAVRKMAEYANRSKQGLLDTFINVKTGDCAGIFWRKDGHSWYENTPKNTYQISIPKISGDEDWGKTLQENVNRAIARLKEETDEKVNDVVIENIVNTKEEALEFAKGLI